MVIHVWYWTYFANDGHYDKYYYIQWIEREKK